MKKEVIIYKEGFVQSVFADAFTFGILFATMAGNHYLLADNKITYFIFF